MRPGGKSNGVSPFFETPNLSFEGRDRNVAFCMLDFLRTQTRVRARFRPQRHVRADGDACLCNEDHRVRHLCAPSGGEDLGPGRRLRKQHGSFRLCR